MEKKKIYYIANARMPSEKAHGIQLAKMCEAFLLEGADLELILPKRKGSAENFREFYGLKSNIPIKMLPVLNFGFVLSSFSFMISYYFYLRKKRDGIIYTIDMDNFSFVLVRFLRMPYFSEIHDSKNYGFIWNIFLKKINGVIAINGNVKKSLKNNFNLNEKKILVKPNGIDLEMFQLKISKDEARAKLNLPQDKKLALYVGREISWKGMEILNEAEKFLERDIIKVISNRPYTEMPLWLKAADVVLALGTKTNDYSYLYTSPMKIFEYLASERPIIASNTPANREILSDSEAYFYEPDDPKDLAEKIKYVLSNPTDAQSKIDAASKKALQYTWTKRAKDILEFMNVRHSVLTIYEKI